MLSLLFTGNIAADTYYISTAGSDTNSGRSIQSPWRSVSRVNGAQIAPGDSILFRRGDFWRETIRPHSGRTGSPVYYGGYGAGPKPLFLGSVARNEPGMWRNTGPHLWTTIPAEDVSAASGREFPSVRIRNWTLYVTERGRADLQTTLTDSIPSSGALTVRIGKGSDRRKNAVQVYSRDRFPVRCGALYKISFRGRTSRGPAEVWIGIHKPDSAWDQLSPVVSARIEETVAKEGNSVYIRCHSSALEARLTLFFGTLPGDQRVELRDITIVEVPNDEITEEVGNIIFNDGERCGVRKFAPGDVQSEGDFYFDGSTRQVTLMSAGHPAARFTAIELALAVNIIDQGDRNNVLYDGLALQYSGLNGIAGGNVHHIIIRNCDVSFIGGAVSRGRFRKGNGIEFWSNAADILVERCTIREVFDAGVTNQNQGTPAVQQRIIYRHNTIDRCEYAFELWNRPVHSRTSSVFFINNTCSGAGEGWGHTQRPDPSGRFVCLFTHTAEADSIVIAGNIFDEAKEAGLYIRDPRRLNHQLISDYNCWRSTTGSYALIDRKHYSYDVPESLTENYGWEQHSHQESGTGSPAGFGCRSLIVPDHILGQRMDRYPGRAPER